MEDFDQEKWSNECERIVYEAILAKFSQNEDMKRTLLETNDDILAEASPNDKVFAFGSG